MFHNERQFTGNHDSFSHSINRQLCLKRSIVLRFLGKYNIRYQLKLTKTTGTLHERDTTITGVDL